MRRTSPSFALRLLAALVATTVLAALLLFATSGRPASAQEASAKLTLNGNPNPVMPGRAVAFSIVLENTSIVVLSDVVVTSTIPDCEFTVDRLSGSGIVTHSCAEFNVTAPFTNIVEATAVAPDGTEILIGPVEVAITMRDEYPGGIDPGTRVLNARVAATAEAEPRQNALRMGLAAIGSLGIAGAAWAATNARRGRSGADRG